MWRNVLALVDPAVEGVVRMCQNNEFSVLGAGYVFKEENCVMKFA